MNHIDKAVSGGLGIAAAIDNLRNHTLSRIRGRLARLIYLASTRDYNTGHYHHEGLAARFTEPLAESALAACHTEAFRSLAYESLEGIVRELRVYLSSSGVSPNEILSTWEKLEPYRVTIPRECDPLTAQLFVTNVNIGLAILRSAVPEAKSGID